MCCPGLGGGRGHAFPAWRWPSGAAGLGVAVWRGLWGAGWTLPAAGAWPFPPGVDWTLSFDVVRNDGPSRR